jgi:hypothetical protein
MNERFPNKRHLINYFQPHNPYLGPSSTGFEYHSSLHKTVTRSPISENTLQEAYRENLDIVLEEVKALLDELSGKTIVTSDHSELIGERRDVVAERSGSEVEYEEDGLKGHLRDTGYAV